MMCLVTEIVSGAPAIPFEVELTQPGGASIRGFVKGDEGQHWYETADGFTISPALDTTTSSAQIRDDADPAWYYVTGFDGNGVAQTTVISADSPPPMGLAKGIRPASRFTFDSGRQNSALGEPFINTIHNNATPVLMLLVEYDDTPGTTPVREWRKMLSSGVIDYFDRASFGAVILNRARETSRVEDDGIIGWLNLGAEHPDPGGNFGSVQQNLASDALLAADQYIDYSSYDTNADGIVSSGELAIVVVVAGNEGATGGFSPSVWGHTWCFSQIPTRVLDNVQIGSCLPGWSYAMIGEIQQNHQATLGIVVHELGHLIFDLPDLYDIDASTKGINQYGIMGFGGWGKKTSDSFFGETPVLPSAWSKVTLGWADASEGTGHEYLTAVGHPDANWSNSVYRISTSNPDEYFLVENRQELGYDAGLANWSVDPYCGLAVWHIDDSKTTNRVDHDRWVDLLEADNTEAEHNNNLDLFSNPNSVLIRDNTSPSMRRKNGNNTEIIVKNVSACVSEIMSVEFTRPVTELLNNSQAIGDRAGFAVAIDADTVAVGARLDDTFGIVDAGTVSLYTRTTRNGWMHVKNLSSPEPQPNALFGHAVDVHGDTLIAGEHRKNANGFNSGAITVFNRHNGGANNWGPVPEYSSFTAADTTSRDQFGSSVSIDGTVVVVGAPFAHGTDSRSGAAYVFDLDNRFPETKLLPARISDNALFGGAVNISGDTIVVGAYRDSSQAGDSGSAYVFERNEGGVNNWGLVTRLTSPVEGVNEQFGYSVAVDGDTIAVGSRLANLGPLAQTGSVDIYQKSNGNGLWNHIQKIQPGDLNGGDHFGTSLSLHSNMLVVGAPKSSDLADRAGKAYVFVRDSNDFEWRGVQHLYNELTSLRDEFGISVGVNDQQIVVGSWLDNRSANNTGGAYIFTR